MGGSYLRNPEMAGVKPFRCFNCNKMLALKIHAPVNIDFICPRCKTFVKLVMKEPSPLAVEVLQNQGAASA